MHSLIRLAYNDILSKGFDSVAQECFLWINNPGLAAEVFNKHGHAPDWKRLKRDKGGRYDHIASVCSRLIRVADTLDAEGKIGQANEVDQIMRIIASNKRG